MTTHTDLVKLARECGANIDQQYERPVISFGVSGLAEFAAASRAEAQPTQAGSDEEWRKSKFGKEAEKLADDYLALNKEFAEYRAARASEAKETYVVPEGYKLVPIKPVLTVCEHCLKIGGCEHIPSSKV